MKSPDLRLVALSALVLFAVSATNAGASYAAHRPNINEALTFLNDACNKMDAASRAGEFDHYGHAAAAQSELSQARDEAASAYNAVP